MTAIEDVIRSVRNRVQNDKGYLGNSEARTKYVIIDRLLRTLRWDTADPERVQLEFMTGNSTKKADYALFKRGIEKPAGVVEAKFLPTVEINKCKELHKQKDQAIKHRYERLQKGGEANKRDTLFDGEVWSGLKEAHETQLKEYVHDLDLRAGYGVLTNGNDWWIYDLKKYDLGNGVSAFAKAVIAETSVLYDDLPKPAEVLNLIRRDISWPSL